MTDRGRKKPVAALATLGCKVNQCETAAVAEALREAGFSVIPFPSRADVYVINTCTVTARTDFQSRQLVRRACRANPEAVVAVTGCYAQCRPEELRRIPGVRLIAGNAEKERLPERLRELLREKHPPGIGPSVEVGDIRDCRKAGSLWAGSFPEHTRAFLKIQDGCDAACSYCTVPRARGPVRSVPPEEVLRRLSRLAEAGYREVVLTGIHLGAYGRDLQGSGDLTDLLERVEDGGIVDRLRLSSIEPGEIPDRMLALLRRGKRLCRHLHVPLQSGDDGILRAMNRTYGREFYRTLVERITAEVPGCAVGADVMAGFPGEDGRSFANTVRLIEGMPLAYLHVFPYSRRPGTPAAEFPDQVGDGEKKERAALLRELGNRKRRDFAACFIGKEVEVLLEDRRDRETGLRKGFSGEYVPVLVNNGEKKDVNRLVPVVPVEAREGRLVGAIGAPDPAAAKRPAGA
ncbi:MAG TPA: tRNA (N(6)-L-threonylcarbamoyladenosine(37)-C(2))-methylthiotransferase MtaB [Syntrophales bacterium]|nr:tRNA (N(6)-L-threonylcarbamoyladenosine(37)-C(2))-methylthiotransferase MtaB [Syntrophales bacterium]